MSSPAILWFRRDLRVSDHPALLTAARHADLVLGVFVLDERLRRPAGRARRTFLYRCLRDLDSRLDGRLLVLHGRPDEEIPQLPSSVGSNQPSTPSRRGHRAPSCA